VGPGHFRVMSCPPPVKNRHFLSARKSSWILIRTRSSKPLIARKPATPVKSISQAGPRGHLEDLEQSIGKVRPGFLITKKDPAICTLV
jgi:hypothetical protein